MRLRRKKANLVHTCPRSLLEAHRGVRMANVLFFFTFLKFVCYYNWKKMGGSSSSSFWASVLVPPVEGGRCLCAACCARFVVPATATEHRCPDCGSVVIGAEVNLYSNVSWDMRAAAVYPLFETILFISVPCALYSHSHSLTSST